MLSTFSLPSAHCSPLGTTSFHSSKLNTLSSAVISTVLFESDLFVQAYALVTSSLPKWWWSSQLLILTGTALTCWSVEGQTLRREIAFANQEAKQKNPRAKPKPWTPTWWFVLLGFFGSMSVGGPLFLAQLDSTPKKRPQARTVPTFLALLILLGEASVIATPFLATMSKGFIYNLVLTHALFLIPSFLVFNPDSQRRFSTFSLPLLYFILALIALASHTTYTLPFVLSPIMKPIILYTTLWSNHCQTSISADLIFNNVLAAAYILRSSWQLKKPHVGVLLTLAMPVLSVSTVFPLYLGWKERQLVTKDKKKA
ncbi:hypothetical protein BX616_006644 [Lobosporangium transversale]|uniref:Uncharacterized protein n=1 Tax=Lobosporangium transversale TaxID=64571 RepID=A0A1Y2G8M8_9FUNG|nr:hypothetical protein BCR41DRAFT_362726 [Lobosporangium transversale]KAF9915216.1 hypothetical protein BX616_006644 [Lobosporangium transversale]ORZ04395.1 hypothetical protein BCR41DRAFT_362726 [Lobosporangium transversale]|eukprot:XP_021876503.1 hypothetical protein BCR41DRAFT_362726 [Lobosporangium transversale]